MAIPFQQCPTPPMTPALYQACIQAVHVITPTGKIFKAGRAVLFILMVIGYPKWVLQLLIYPPFILVIEFIYWVVAKNRPFFSRFLFTKE